MCVSFQVFDAVSLTEFRFGPNHPLDILSTDLLAQYSAQSLNQVVKSEMTFQNMHYAHRFKATVYRAMQELQWQVHRGH